jgi:hypothetical protein
VIPNFFLAGAPKAGTTSLFHYLDRHPRVYLSPIKEPCYFADEIRPENFSEEWQPRIRQDLRQLEQYLAGPMREKRFSGPVIEWDSYLKLFANVRSETAIGEASVQYLWSESAARNIAARIPGARILLLLRDPAERAFSQYLHGVTSGFVGVSFHEHVRNGLNPGGKFDVCHPFLELGRYALQVRRYLAAFPREQVFIRLYEDYREQPLATVREVLRFLDVDPDVPIGLPERHNRPRVPRNLALGRFLKRTGIWSGAKKLIPSALLPLARSAAIRPRKELAMDPRDRAFLVDYYRDDIRDLAELLNRDLRAWLTV